MSPREFAIQIIATMLGYQDEIVESRLDEDFDKDTVDRLVALIEKHDEEIRNEQGKEN